MDGVNSVTKVLVLHTLFRHLGLLGNVSQSIDIYRSYCLYINYLSVTNDMLILYTFIWRNDLDTFKYQFNYINLLLIINIYMYY